MSQKDFLVLTASGALRAGPVYAEEATMIFRLLPEAANVVRQSDGVLIATKVRGLLTSQLGNPRVPMMYAGIGNWGSS